MASRKHQQQRRHRMQNHIAQPHPARIERLDLKRQPEECARRNQRHGVVVSRLNRVFRLFGRTPAPMVLFRLSTLCVLTILLAGLFGFHVTVIMPGCRFFRADANRLFDCCDENLPIADFSGLGAVDHGRNGVVARSSGTTIRF